MHKPIINIRLEFNLYVIRVRFPAEKHFSLRRFQIGSEAHRACYPMDTGGSFPGQGVKRQEREAVTRPIFLILCMCIAVVTL
jgi:hypothetical protein